MTCCAALDTFYVQPHIRQNVRLAHQQRSDVREWLAGMDKADALQVLGMDLLKSGFYSVLPWITMAVSANAAGLLADTLIQRGTSITLVRKVMQTVTRLHYHAFSWPCDKASLPTCCGLKHVWHVCAPDVACLLVPAVAVVPVMCRPAYI